MAGAGVNDPSGIRVVPANEASWDDLQAVLGPARCHDVPCFCQRFKISWGQWRSVSNDQRADRLLEQTGCEEPESGTTCGLVAYDGDVPVGWCRVEPRSAFTTLGRTPWVGREENPTDETVWAVVCFIVRLGHRRRGITHLLTVAAVEFAREHGARVIEGYPMEVIPGKNITWGELHVGGVDGFLEAGFSVVGRPSKRRVVVRLELR